MFCHSHRSRAVCILTAAFVLTGFEDLAAWIRIFHPKGPPRCYLVSHPVPQEIDFTPPAQAANVTIRGPDRAGIMRVKKNWPSPDDMDSIIYFFHFWTPDWDGEWETSAWANWHLWSPRTSEQEWDVCIAAKVARSPQEPITQVAEQSTGFRSLPTPLTISSLVTYIQSLPPSVAQRLLSTVQKDEYFTAFVDDEGAALDTSARARLVFGVSDASDEEITQLLEALQSRAVGKTARPHPETTTWGEVKRRALDE